LAACVISTSIPYALLVDVRACAILRDVESEPILGRRRWKLTPSRTRNLRHPHRKFKTALLCEVSWRTATTMTISSQFEGNANSATIRGFTPLVNQRGKIPQFTEPGGYTGLMVDGRKGRDDSG
jgi:hypothetical protein